MARKEILEAATQCVCGDREQDYGSPEKSFEVIADLWQAYLSGCGIIKACDTLKEALAMRYLSPKDVAAMMVLFKMARVATGHNKPDNWIDAAGYAACGGELEEVYDRE